uniref:(California timema) hypothetical protein n=1 Tax=Timema californicum TaxID=61474 RepID=A0A7R9JEE8_TIMCA|nr:unnamed protein product [Timema californicum]
MTENMALHDYRIVTYLDVTDDYFEEEANQVVVIQRRHKDVVWQDIFPMLEIDNPETRGLPMLHLQQILTTLQFYATEGFQESSVEAALRCIGIPSESLGFTAWTYTICESELHCIGIPSESLGFTAQTYTI